MAFGNFRLTVHKKPDKVITIRQQVISIREDNNSADYVFDYQNLDAATLTTNQILYQEGVANDPVNTYIVVASSYNQNIGTGNGTFELRIVSKGSKTQLDKIIPVSIGTNNFNIAIDFRSRPDTTFMEKSTPNWTIPIILTKQDILDHCSDFDGDEIVEWGLKCGGDTNFIYNGQQYIADTMIPLDTIDQLGFSYVPDNNPLGYSVEYPHYVKDATGLITKV